MNSLRDQQIREVLNQKAEEYRISLTEKERSKIDHQVLNYLHNMPFKQFISYIEIYRKARDY